MHKIEVIVTGDNSSSLFVPELNEHYHSVHGAVQEAEHVYIKAGLLHLMKDEIRVLEIGFGTGLNAFLSLIKATKLQQKIIYTSIELYPLDNEIISQLNYPVQINIDFEKEFKMLHSANWNETITINTYFKLKKIEADLTQITINEQFDVIYFDAFAPNIQPELWTEAIFSKMYNSLDSEGILTTYCAKGIVKEALRNVGFKIKRLAGPPGKWQMLRATKSL